MNYNNDIEIKNSMTPQEYYNYLMNRLQDVGNNASQGVPPSGASTPTTSFWALSPEERQNILYGAGQQAPDLGASIRGTGNNILKNAQANMAEIGTGLTNIMAHPAETLETIGGYIGRNYKNPYKIIGDVSDAMTSPYNFKLGDIGNKTLGEIAAGAAVGAYENPVDALMDFASLGGGEALGAIVKSTKAGQKAVRAVENITAKAGFDLGGDINKAVQGGMDVNKSAVQRDLIEATKPIQTPTVMKAKPIDLALAIKSAEEGLPVTGKALEIKNSLKEFSTKWDDVFKKYSPHTWVDPEELSIIQKIARDTSDTYQSVKKNITPILDTLKEENGLTKVRELSNSGNELATKVLDAKRLYDTGEIFPVTHGLAEVDKTKAIDKSLQIKNKRFSTREFGNASYVDIAKQLMRPSEYLENLGVNFANSEMARQILEGASLGGVKSLAPDDIGKAVYVQREALEQAMRNEKDIHEVLKSAKKEKMRDDDIPLDETVAKVLENKTERRGQSFGGATGDTVRLSKQSILGSASYLGGNALTAATTAMLNSGPYIISDIIAAAKSKGRLLQELGLYRTDARTTKMNTAIAQAISNINDVGGGKALRWVDRKIQNWWGEVGAHAALRKTGVKSISEATKMQLADIIHNTRRAGLINDPVSSLPAGVQSLLGVTNPFFNWIETATKSTYYQLKQAPFLTNVVVGDILGNIGYDQEMQNRLKLGVKSTRPYVSYKFDDKTGEIKETTAEFMPITSSFKFAEGVLNRDADMLPASIPALSDLINVAQGKDKYGKPLKRAVKLNEVTQAVGSTRWKMNPQTGEIQKIGSQGDEMLATAVKALMVPTSLWNRTVAPAIGGMMGMHYNQPYAQSILGDFSDTDVYNNILVGGNPDKPRTGMDVIRAISGRSEYPYFEDRDYMTPAEARKFMRGVARQKSRRL